MDGERSRQLMDELMLWLTYVALPSYQSLVPIGMRWRVEGRGFWCPHVVPGGGGTMEIVSTYACASFVYIL